MFERKDKRRLYWLIDQYLSHKMNGWNFSDDYYKSYCLEADLDTFTDKEEKAFDALADIATRFSDIEDDLKTYPGVYYTPEELHKKIVETKEVLKEYWVDYADQDRQT